MSHCMARAIRPGPRRSRRPWHHDHPRTSTARARRGGSSPTSRPETVPSSSIRTLTGAPGEKAPDQRGAWLIGGSGLPASGVGSGTCRPPGGGGRRRPGRSRCRRRSRSPPQHLAGQHRLAERQGRRRHGQRRDQELQVRRPARAPRRRSPEDQHARQAAGAIPVGDRRQRLPGSPTRHRRPRLDLRDRRHGGPEEDRPVVSRSGDMTRQERGRRARSSPSRSAATSVDQDLRHRRQAQATHRHHERHARHAHGGAREHARCQRLGRITTATSTVQIGVVARGAPTYRR